MKNNLHYPLQQNLVIEIQKRLYTAILQIENNPKTTVSVKRALEGVSQDIRHITATYYFEDDLLLLLFGFFNFSAAYLEDLKALDTTKHYKISA